jgi:hypothetical protein
MIQDYEEDDEEDDFSERKRKRSKRNVEERVSTRSQTRKFEDDEDEFFATFSDEDTERFTRSKRN